MDARQKMVRLLASLSFFPSLEHIVRALVLDYLSVFKPNQAMIWHLSKDDSLICLAVYGADNSMVGTVIPGNIWRSVTGAAALSAHAVSGEITTWCDALTQVSTSLFAQNVLIGFLSVRFLEPVEDLPTMFMDVESLSIPLSTYLALRFLEPPNHNGSNGHSGLRTLNTLEFTNPTLTERQRAILSGIALEKTNNEIARDLGYSVSTIRHETMRIFETLGVSDRQEAASHAAKLKLI